MRALKQREKTIAIILVSLLVLWGIIVFVQRWSQSQEEGFSSKDVVLEKYVRQNNFIAREPGLKKQLDSLEQIIGKAADEGVEVSAMVKTAERMAKENRVHINNIQPRRSITQNNVKAFVIEITFEGSWKAVNGFIQSLQNKPYYIYMDSLQLERYSDASVDLKGVMVVKRWKIIF